GPGAPVSASSSGCPRFSLFRFYCDYCDTYLTHDSPSVRKTHCSGRKHKENVKDYYQKWMEEQAQSLIDKTSKAWCCGRFPGEPVPVTSLPPSEEPFPNVEPGLPLTQLHSIFSCPFSS
uniref:Small nuclear ribonucleoprotein polypeptide C n=2 Tax=Athene cunicularia TaxID=194338 RepID=A0A663MGA0_ATHCN